MTPGPSGSDRPADVGVAADLSDRLDGAVGRALATTGIPGASVLVARHGATVHHSWYGWAQDHDEQGPLAARRPVRPHTIFDIASVTKVVATTAVIMSLVDRGRLDVDDPVERHLPRPGRLAGRGIRISDLLEHRAGLPAWLPLYLWARERDTALDVICSADPAPVGASRNYSDLGMALLGAIAEHAGNARLDELLQRFVTDPLGLAGTSYRPSRPTRLRCAATSTGNPTEHRMITTDDPVPVDGQPEDFPGWRHHTLVGEVNDGNAAHTFGGVAGHAGVFSTVTDLAVFGNALLGYTKGGLAPPWTPETIDTFTTPKTEAGQGFGFTRQRLHALGADVATDASFGHRGFTGCELVIDPARHLVIVMLSNRLHTEQDPPTDDAPVWRAVASEVIAATSK